MISILMQPAVHMPMQQPSYFAAPPGPIPASALNVTYAGAAGIQQSPRDYERPPPYAYTQTGNAPPLAAGSFSETPSETVPVDV